MNKETIENLKVRTFKETDLKTIYDLASTYQENPKPILYKKQVYAGYEM